MELTEFDIVVVVTMTLAVVSMSFVFPAMGLTDGDSVGESEIPEFNVTEDRFDFVGDRPAPPGTPTNIRMDWNGSQDAAFSDNQVWLNGDTNGGTELLILPNSSTGGMEVRVNIWNGSGQVNETEVQTFDSSGESGHMRVNDYSLLWSVESYETVNGNVTTEVSIEIQDQPVTGGSWVSRVPIIGGVFDTAAATAATLAWFGSIILWGFQAFFEGSANALAVAVDVISYVLNLLLWLSTTYTSIVSAAPGWVSVFVALPGLLLTAILAKMVMIGVSLLPTT